jgi:hypothetical protein
MTEKKYDINERKKADLASLIDNVEALEFQQQQQQAVVEELELKTKEFSEQLKEADGKREQAAIRSDRVIDAASHVRSIMHKASMVKKQTSRSDAVTSKTLTEMKKLVQQVIFAADLVNRLVLMIQKKKSSGALISSELSRVLESASTDADTAVTATLKALTSCHTAVAASEDGARLTHQELQQSIELYAMISGDKNILNEVQALQQCIEEKEHALHQGTDISDLAEQEKVIMALMNKIEISIRSFDRTDPDDHSLLGLASQADQYTKQEYELALTASSYANRELEEAKAKLAQTSLNLESLEAGLSAASAAAALV